ncbi:MAG: site-2 protease family protein [bacterium]
MDIATIIISIAILVFSVVIHEVSHGVAALSQGDQTAKIMGRLTLNPLKHIDPFGSVILPLICAISHTGIILGWAKPVPVNFNALKSGKKGEALVAFAGPLSNIILAVVAGLVIRLFGAGLPSPAILALEIVVLTNLVLAVFNLVPIPPLDGSRILSALLPQKGRQVMHVMEQYGLLIALLFVFFLWQLIIPIVYFLASVISGIRLQ